MLKRGTVEEIQSMFEQMKFKTRSLIKELVRTVYFMRGAIQYKDILLLTYGEREIIQEFLTGRLEEEGKKRNPVY